MGRAVKRIHEWADDTETGDRDELVPGVPDSTWRMVSVTARECLGAVEVPGRRRVLRRARPRRGRARRHRRHQPRIAGHRRHGRAGGAARARRGGGRRGARAGRPGHRRGHRRAERGRGRGRRAPAGQADRPVRRRSVGRGGRRPRARARGPAARPLGGAPQARGGGAVGAAERRGGLPHGVGGERREEPDAAAGRKIAQAALEDVLDTTARLLKAFEEPDPAKRYDVVWLAEVGADRHKVLYAAPLWVGGLLRSGCSAVPRWCSPRPRWPSGATSTRWPGSGVSRPARP